MKVKRLLDLFCGAGGCSAGYHQAGFEVIGVDLKPQANYPFKFIQQDALQFLELYGMDFDAIHASPPCQKYSRLKNANRAIDDKAVDLVRPTQLLLRRMRRPYVIENVVGAPLHRPIGLCGSMFNLGSGGRYLQRHRLFECSFPIEVPFACRHRGEAVGVYGKGQARRDRYTFRSDKKGYQQYGVGGYQGTYEEKCEAMDINWMTDKEIGQSIPPAYTKFIGNVLMEYLLH